MRENRGGGHGGRRNFQLLKHFPGYGGNADTHTGTAVDDRSLDTFRQEASLPFQAGIDAGADAVLVSHNIVTAMDLGGDDFVPKPFDLSVLSAKVRSTLRRCYDFAAPQPVLAHRGAELDTADASLRYQGEKLDLSRNEFRILQVLLEQKGRTVSRDALMQKLWETDSFVDENTLSVNVNRLRRKLDELGLTDFIRTKKGMGYLIENDE